MTRLHARALTNSVTPSIGLTYHSRQLPLVKSHWIVFAAQPTAMFHCFATTCSEYIQVTRLNTAGTILPVKLENTSFLHITDRWLSVPVLYIRWLSSSVVKEWVGVVECCRELVARCRPRLRMVCYGDACSGGLLWAYIDRSAYQSSSTYPIRALTRSSLTTSHAQWS